METFVFQAYDRLLQRNQRLLDAVKEKNDKIKEEEELDVDTKDGMPLHGDYFEILS